LLRAGCWAGRIEKVQAIVARETDAVHFLSGILALPANEYREALEWNFVINTTW